MDDLERVKRKGLELQYIEEQTPEICLAAVKEHGSALLYVKEQTPEICLAAVREMGSVLHAVKEQTPEICLAAVKNNGYALEYVKEQTPEICLAAVRSTGYALQHVKDQTPELCLAAVSQEGFFLQFVKEQTTEICVVALKKSLRSLRHILGVVGIKYRVAQYVSERFKQVHGLPENKHMCAVIQIDYEAYAAITPGIWEIIEKGDLWDAPWKVYAVPRLLLIPYVKGGLF